MADELNLERRFIREAGQSGDIATLIEPIIEENGYRLIRVIISGREGATLQIMAERPDGSMSIEDCEKISHELSPFLDSHDPIDGEYRLEISSPGIDRPLVRASDFIKWQGFEAKIELKLAIEGRKRFKGIIDGFYDDEIHLITKLKDEEEPITLGFKREMISSAKLIMSDELLKKASSRDNSN